MTNQQEQKDSSITDDLVTSTAKVNTNKADVETVSEAGGSFANTLFWILGLGGLIAATLVNQYLPAYWQPASSIWVRIGAILACVIVGIICLLLTQQGRGFSKLLKDTRVELRRVTWPTKDETIEYTWKVLVVIIISGLLIYVLDGISSVLVAPFIK